MFEEERETEKPDKIVEIVEDILRFNKQKQEGQGIKILTPDEMLSRLPISLAQLQAGNNSEKIKNEIRKLLYSLYRSKNITKQEYNNLIQPLWIKNTIIAHKIFIMIMIMIVIIIISSSSISISIKDTHYKMETIFMNTENSKMNEPRRFRLDLTDKLYLKNPNKNMALVNLSI